MAVRIEYQAFRFIAPSELNERQFLFYKQQISAYPNFKFQSEIRFFDNFKHFFYIWIGSFGLFLFALLLEQFRVYSWIVQVVGFPALLLPIVTIIPFLLSLFSFVEFKMEESYFFGKLKKHIRKANSFEDFVYLRLIKN